MVVLMEMTKNQGLERVPPTGEGLAEGSTGLDTFACKCKCDLDNCARRVVSERRRPCNVVRPNMVMANVRGPRFSDRGLLFLHSRLPTVCWITCSPGNRLPGSAARVPIIDRNNDYAVDHASPKGGDPLRPVLRPKDDLVALSYGLRMQLCRKGSCGGAHLGVGIAPTSVSVVVLKIRSTRTENLAKVIRQREPLRGRATRSFS